MKAAKRTWCTLVLAGVLAVVLVATCFANAIVVGAAKESEPVFADAEATGWFECLDKSKRIPFAAINDDYCDCADGSDEPGTAACVGLDIRGALRPQTIGGEGFLCANVGFQSEHIALSKVSDGICDCCDGSDELSTISCPNVCATVEKERAATAEVEAAMRAKATAARVAMRETATARRAALAKQLSELKANAARFEATVVELEATVSALLEKERAKKEELKKAYDSWIEARDQSKARPSGALCVGWRQTGKCRANGPREVEQDKDCDDVITDIASGYCECIPDTEAAENDAAVDAATDVPSVRHGFACKHEPLTCAYVCTHDGKPGLREEAPPSDGTTFVLPELMERNNDIANGRNSADEAHTKAQEIETTLARPLGTEDLLRTLDGQSFTLDHQDYTYELVLFQNVFQHPKGARHGPSLGKWDSFAESTYSSWAKDAFDLSQMIYNNGARCWNGVVRSTDVHVVCGAENRLALLEEPSMCKYSMVFETPAMCEE